MDLGYHREPAEYNLEMTYVLCVMSDRLEPFRNCVVNGCREGRRKGERRKDKKQREGLGI